MHFSQSDDTHLLALLREGSALAFKELYERYWLYVYRLALRKVSREDVAQEMAQQLFENCGINERNCSSTMLRPI